MSWEETARTNYVSVINMDGLKAYFDKFGGTDAVEIAGDGHTGKVCFLAKNQDDGSFPSVNDDGEEFYWGDVREFLAPEQVLVVMSSGADKARCISGYALAYHTTTGDSVKILLSDIYQRAAAAFNVPEHTINACEY